MSDKVTSYGDLLTPTMTTKEHRDLLRAVYADIIAAVAMGLVRSRWAHASCSFHHTIGDDDIAQSVELLRDSGVLKFVHGTWRLVVTNEA